jgi:hypothetical protein
LEYAKRINPHFGGGLIWKMVFTNKM